MEDPERPVRLSSHDEDVDLDSLVLRDKVRMLYVSGPGGLAMNGIAGLLLALTIQTPGNLPHLLAWLCTMMAVLLLRALDLLVWHLRRRHDDPHGITRFSIGVCAVALTWAAFPLLFVSSESITGSAVMVVVLAALANGSPTFLAVLPPLAIGYCLSLLLPFSFMFLAWPGPGNTVLGVLGLVDSLVMIGVCLAIHRQVMASIRLSRINQILTTQAMLQQDSTLAANGMLQAAQEALHEANRSLESRIEARTVDLQHEIAEHRDCATALGRLASTDALTGLFNRATLSERLTRVLDQAALEDAKAAIPVAVLFLDLDGFKQINDAQGHCIGDRVLRAVADRLARCCAAATDLARWGGDEFVIVATGLADEAAATALAQTIRRSMAEPIDVGLHTVRVGVTIGIALYPMHGSSQDDLIRAADVAMYAGKNEGGDRVNVFDPHLAVLVSERHLLEQDLRRALADDALSVHYQPILDVASGRCDVMEALLRWTHPERGAIGPDVFIPIAEQSGQIVAIGRFVLMEACKAAMRWPGFAPPAVSVNVSIAQILSGLLPEDVEAALHASGLPVHRLQLEITESMFAANYGLVIPVLEALQARGIRLALDDFGSGFSSLARLKTLPISTIKIDKGFVQEDNAEGGAIIRAMLLIAQAMRLDVTAEGVETEAQSEMLTKLGATRLQGYLLSRPMHAELVTDWLLSRLPEDWTVLVARTQPADRLPWPSFPRPRSDQLPPSLDDGVAASGPALPVLALP